METSNEYRDDELYFRPTEATTKKSDTTKLSETDCISRQIDSTKTIKQTQYIFLIDFDDTMFPSSYFTQNIQFVMDNTSGKLNFQIEESKQTEFINNLSNVGNSTLQLLNKLFSQIDSTQIKIVTNSAIGWVSDALSMAATFVKTYKIIKDLLIYYKIEILYARNYDLIQSNWKRQCFNVLLSQFNLNKKYNIIISIGDQWGDHNAIKQSSLFAMYKQNILHHQIKLLECPDCSYLCLELKYIKDIIESYILSNFNHDSITLEFDG